MLVCKLNYTIVGSSATESGSYYNNNTQEIRKCWAMFEIQRGNKAFMHVVISGNFKRFTITENTVTFFNSWYMCCRFYVTSSSTFTIKN